MITLGMQCWIIILIYRLTKQEVKEMLHEMPKLQKNNDTFFRGLGNRGVISFR